MDAANSKTTKVEGNPTPAGSKKPKSVKKTRAVKEPKPKKEKAPRELLCVFAFRLTKAQRDRIHRAAGPGKATRFVRSASLAAAEGDRPAFDQLLAQAKTNLK